MFDICCQCKLSLDRCQPMLACQPIQKNLLNFVGLCILALAKPLQSLFCNRRMFLFFTPGLWKLYLCSTFHSNQNTMCFKEEQGATETNPHIHMYTCKGCNKANDQGLCAVEFIQVTLLTLRVLRVGDWDFSDRDSKIVAMGNCSLLHLWGS